MPTREGIHLKICYCDESGTGDEPIAVMAGIVVDSQRMHVTKDHWGELLGELSRIVGEPVSELHTRDFYPGNGVWHRLDGPMRANVITLIAEWLRDRKHHVVFSAVDKAAFRSSLGSGQIPAELSTLWRFLGMHIVLSVQREFQRQEKTKGHTLFIFDEEKQEHLVFADLVRNPPSWSDTYYSRTKKQPRLSHVIDVPYFADSRHVALIQLADFVAFFLRRHLEIKEGHSPERYPGEAARLDTWVQLIAGRSITASSMYPTRDRCACADLFYAHAPLAARALAKAGG
jgi:hypothetical protein